MKRIKLTVNGDIYTVRTEPNRTLLDVLRDDLYLLGTKKGCGRGECGACTVLMEGEAVNSCLVLAVEAEGHQIETIEGLTNGRETLHPLQRAFLEEGAIQCGFCTPGMILTAKSLLSRDHKLNEEEIRKGLAGNLCRCGGYPKIIKAVLSVQRKSFSRTGTEDLNDQLEQHSKRRPSIAQRKE